MLVYNLLVGGEFIFLMHRTVDERIASYGCERTLWPWDGKNTRVKEGYSRAVIVWVSAIVLI
jgi:hypothetical protein